MKGTMAMKTFFAKLGRALVAASLGIGLLWGAAPIAHADEAGLAAYREAMLTPAKPDKRIFREQLLFFGPMLKADLDFQAMAKKDERLRAQGNLELVGTDEKGNTKPLNIPFYIEQARKDMTLYFQIENEWFKFKTPELTAVAMDMMATPQGDEIQEEMALTKDALVLAENENQRTMLVTLDGNRLADSLRSSENTDNSLSEADKAQQEAFLKYLEQGLRSQDLWYTWTIDKRDWQTITVGFDLSNFLHAAAKAVLDDPNVKLNSDERQILESVAYYSELKSYTTYLDPEVKQTITLPKELKKAKSFNEIVPDNKMAQ